MLIGWSVDKLKGKMYITIEAVYDNGEFFLEEIPNIKKARVLITFIREIDDNVKGKIKFPTKKLGKIKKIGREDLYGDYLSDRHLYTGLCIQ